MPSGTNSGQNDCTSTNGEPPLVSWPENCFQAASSTRKATNTTVCPVTRQAMSKSDSLHNRTVTSTLTAPRECFLAQLKTLKWCSGILIWQKKQPRRKIGTCQAMAVAITCTKAGTVCRFNILGTGPIDFFDPTTFCIMNMCVTSMCVDDWYEQSVLKKLIKSMGPVLKYWPFFRQRERPKR